MFKRYEVSQGKHVTIHRGSNVDLVKLFFLFFIYLFIFFSIIVALCDLVHEIETILRLCNPLATAGETIV